ncbi:hypothetical protein JOB18_029439 [Solea senegalensis]|uniref:Uncharacterized protein n=1 Tax=Solea senegalensis TaxID=28829 RepID=A0AAV6RRU9_SOLSE|nr:hypothetical protein JOB18_029439 [Solea senegalensis]
MPKPPPSRPTRPCLQRSDGWHHCCTLLQELGGVNRLYSAVGAELPSMPQMQGQ